MDSWSTVSAGAINTTTMLNMGTGYTSAPTVVVTANGNGTGAQLTANLTANYISSLNIVAGGAGYTTEPTISFYGGGGLEATCTIGTVNGVAGAITSVTVVNGGSGLSDKPKVIITPVNALGSGALLRAEVKNGSVWRIIIEKNGSGYTVAPTLSFYGSSRNFFTATNRPEYFPDAWSNPFVRGSVRNPIGIASSISGQDMSGQDAINRQLPGWEF